MLLDVDPAVLENRLAQAEPAPGRLEVDLRPTPGHPGRAANVLRQPGHQLFGQEQDVFVVGVGCVELEHGELRVVLGREPFVAEDAAELEDALEAADDASLEEELERDPEVLGLVECVVVGFEGSGSAAARHCLAVAVMSPVRVVFDRQTDARPPGQDVRSPRGPRR